LNIIIIEPVVMEGFLLMTVIFASILASRFAQVHTDLEKSYISLQEVSNEKDSAMESLNIYKYIVSASRDFMAFIDMEGRLLEANAPFLKAYNKGRLEVLHNKIDEFFGKEEYESVLHDHFFACSSGETVVFEQWHRFPGMGKRYMVTTLYPYIAMDGNQAGIVYYSMDITDRVRLEQEMVAISETERAAIGMELHDNLAQKLFGIALKASVLSTDMGARFPDQAGAAHEIEDLVNKAMAYTRTIAKSMARMDSDEGGFATTIAELKRLLESRYNIRLDLHIDGDISLGNRLYYSQIYYIIQEAVTNSVKHSKAETISVSLHRNSGDIMLMIKDDGIGIPDKIDLDKGIGMKIMKYRARMIGSSISIKRGRGGGTEVSCVIPLQ
jgi:two-component system sensor kinase FixL